MQTFIGHVLPGIAYFVLGMWHIFNHVKLYVLNPKSYTSRFWFHAPCCLKHLELYLIIAVSASFALVELVGLDAHHPLDPDGSVPSRHLHNFEHSSIGATILTYAALSLALDLFRPPPPAAYGLTMLLAAAAFAQELFLLHLHSSDHNSLEGQYHFLLEIIISLSLITTLIGIGLRRSFITSFVRSLSILFQGVWLMIMGFVLWTPELVPKGCFIRTEEDRRVVRCGGDAALRRAKSLANIAFSWVFIALLVFAVCFYLAALRIYGKENEYDSLTASENRWNRDSESDDGDSDGLRDIM